YAGAGCERTADCRLRYLRQVSHILRAWCGFHAAVQPPSSIRALPVIRLDALLARNTTAPITSSTRPRRPSAIRSQTHCLKPGLSNIAAVIGVSIKVGQIEFTRIPFAPNSHASALVMPSMACLLAQYNTRRGLPTCPICDEMLIMEPGRLAASSLRATARLV